jgi:chromosome segregation ATPase
VRDGWKFVGDLKPEETSESRHRFLVKVEPNASAKLEIPEYHPMTSTVLLSNLTSDDILLYSRQRVLNSDLEKSFREILGQKNQITGLDQQLRLREQEINNISADQNRVRENMKALKGSPEEKTLVQRYATQMNQQEDQLARLRAEMNTLRSQREQANAQLDKMLQDVSFDQEFEGK